MARGATVRAFDIELSDIDRGVYDSLSLKVGQHPSETEPYLVTRVVAFALEQQDGLAFSAGLASGDAPALWVRDLTGQLMAWIEVGTPEASRLHKARKAADRVAVYCHKEPSAWPLSLAGEKVHSAESIELYTLPRKTIELIARGLDRRNTWSLSRMEGTVFLETHGLTHEIPVDRVPWPT